MCTLYSANNQCLLCQPTFTLNNYGKCNKKEDACLMTDARNTTKCLKCHFGTVLSNGKCIGTINCAKNEANCSNCINGFALDRSRKICIDRTGKCQRISGNKGICSKCINNYKRNGFRCIPNTENV